MDDKKGTVAIKVKIGELFGNFEHLNEKKRVKANHEFQKFAANKFQQLTGFSVSDRLFRNVSKSFVTKIKSNKGRKDINVVLADFFEKDVTIEVEAQEASASSSLPLPSFTTPASKPPSSDAETLSTSSGCMNPAPLLLSKRVNALKRPLLNPSELVFPSTPRELGLY